MFGNKVYTAIVLLVAVSYGSANILHHECPQVCPALYSPICATDGNLHKEFSNECELKASNCRLDKVEAKRFSLVDMAWCTSEFVDNLHVKLGNLDLNTAECLKPCPMIYLPMCVTNEVYRGNINSPCELDIYNCLLELNGASKPLRKLQDSHCE